MQKIKYDGCVIQYDTKKKVTTVKPSSEKIVYKTFKGKQIERAKIYVDILSK